MHTFLIGKFNQFWVEISVPTKSEIGTQHPLSTSLPLLKPKQCYSDRNWMLSTQIYLFLRLFWALSRRYWRISSNLKLYSHWYMLFDLGNRQTKSLFIQSRSDVNDMFEIWNLFQRHFRLWKSIEIIDI